MLEATTRIYVRDPDREDNLVPGVVSETLGQKVMVRFLQPVSFRPGAETVVFFHNQSNCFTCIPCQMQRMFSSGQYPTGALVFSGEAEIAENRSSFRVDIHDKSVSATVNDKAQGEVVNISCGGIAMLLETEEYQLNKWLNISLLYDCGEHTGRMQVRSKFQDRDGRFRYGLMADTSEADIISQLTRITQEMQSIKARRASRIGVNNKAGTSTGQEGAEDQSTSEQSDAEKNEQGKATSPDGTQRMHQRNPWPGMAKVYIREQGNLRVLSVDTEDLSCGGISFTSQKYIYEGSEALFEKPINGGFFRVMIAIRNVRVMDGGIHRVGGQFLGAPLAPGKMPKEFGSVASAA